MGARTDTRQRMITSAAVLLSEHGVAGTSVARVLEHSGGPRGSVGFHFPGGRRELLVEALTWVGATVADQLRAGVAAGVDAGTLVRGIAEHYRRQLESTDFTAACPVWASAQEAYDDEALGPIAAGVVRDWVDQLAAALVRDGRSAAEAADVATLCVATLEGAITMARLTRSVRPIELAVVSLEPHLGGGSGCGPGSGSGD